MERLAGGCDRSSLFQCLSKKHSRVLSCGHMRELGGGVGGTNKTREVEIVAIVAEPNKDQCEQRTAR